MAKRMLIDATHPEETRVVVISGKRLEEFDFETASKKQLKGNIYLAKVTRVEPSLQAAFVDYGGNRHGFLAFSEIHPDYYRIPVADREALLAEEAAYRGRGDADFDPIDSDPPARRGRRSGRPPAEPGASAAATAEAADGGSVATAEAADEPAGPEASLAEDEASPAAMPLLLQGERLASEPWPLEDEDEEDAAEARPDEPDESVVGSAEDDGAAALPEPFDGGAAEAASVEPGAEHGIEPGAESGIEHGAEAAAEAGAEGAASLAPGEEDEAPAEPVGSPVLEAPAVEIPVETLGGDEAEEDDADAEPRRLRITRRYKIQEVIKRRQIMLVQVTKEERGNKGAALTTYLSLAGRYCVLMPNTARGGGVSRKITNAGDRKRLKSIIEELDIPDGMAVIVRTAGSERSKTEVKRDYEYLLRLWDEIRELTLRSTAPALVYEEANLIKRSIRDLYSRDIDDITVEGEEGYKLAKAFMRTLTPSHAKRVQAYRDPSVPLFQRFQVESQLDAIHNPVVHLKSGGYIVINSTEALVAIDVNSGRATRERNIEETALRTNMEAAEEVARQLRLRDLAGLIVIDFIDMEESRHNGMVERRLKDAMRHDRARIQLGRISHFGLLELSRQRLRPSLFESSMEQCKHCRGTGHVRSVESTALHVLRSIEEEGIRNRSAGISVAVPTAVALYIFNHKRQALGDIELRHHFRIYLTGDDSLIPPDMRIERIKALEPSEQLRAPVSAPMVLEEEPADEAAVEEPEEAEEEEEAAAAEPAEAPRDEEGGRGRRRSRRRGRRDERRGDERRGEERRGEERRGDERRGGREERRGERAEERRPLSPADVAQPLGAIGEPGALLPEDLEAEGEPLAAAEGNGQEGGQEGGNGSADSEGQRRRRRRGKRGGRRRSRRPGEPGYVAGAEGSENGAENGNEDDAAAGGESYESGPTWSWGGEESEPEPAAAEPRPFDESGGAEAAPFAEMTAGEPAAASAPALAGEAAGPAPETLPSWSAPPLAERPAPAEPPATMAAPVPDEAALPIAPAEGRSGNGQAEPAAAAEEAPEEPATPPGPPRRGWWKRLVE